MIWALNGKLLYYLCFTAHPPPSLLILLTSNRHTALFHPRCHGEQDNVVYDLAKAHGVLVPGQFTTAVPQLRQSDGTTIGADQTQRLLQLNRLLDVSEADASAAVVRKANDDDDVDADAVPSLGEFVTARFNAIVDTGEYSDLKANGLADQYLQSLHRYLNGLQASDSWFDVALGEYAAYQECEGDQLLTWKENGSQTVLDLLLVSLH